MDSGVTITTGQLIAALVFLTGFIGTLLGIVRHQLETRITERDKRIERMEVREEERIKATEKYITTLESAVELMKLQAEATRAALEQKPNARRSSSGDD